MRQTIVLLLAGLSVVCTGAQESARFEGEQAVGEFGSWYEPAVAREDFLLRRFLSPEVGDSLGLTNEQRERLRRELNDLHQKQIELVRQLTQSAMRQAARLTEEKVDIDAVMREVEESGRLRTEIAKLRMRALLLVKEALTPEQFKALRDMIGRQIRQRGERGDGGLRTEKHEGPGKRFPWGKGRERRDHKPENHGYEGEQDRHPSHTTQEGLLPVSEK